MSKSIKRLLPDGYPIKKCDKLCFASDLCSTDKECCRNIQLTVSYLDYSDRIITDRVHLDTFQRKTFSIFRSVKALQRAFFSIL